MENKYSFDGKFEGNILIVGRTGCGKTTFIQNLGKNRMFGNEIIEVFWVSKSFLNKEREDFIRDSFQDQKVHFSYPQDLNNFNYLIKNFMQEKANYLDNDMGELPVVNRLIILDDVSGLADKSEEFSNILTVTRKYGFSCLYVFHTIYPGRQSWEMIMSQTHIFNFFPGSIHSSRILETLSLFASRQKNNYIPNQQIWLNRLYFQISNSKEKKCLTIDTREINELGPGKFRTDVQNVLEQICHFNRNKSDSHFTSYIANCVSPKNLVFYFQKLNLDFDLDNKSLEIELKNSVTDGISKRQYQSSNKENTENGRDSTSTRPETNQEGGGANRMDSSKLPSYTGINKSDFYNENFILDVYILLVKNLNPFSLQRKTRDKLKHEMVYMLWRECIPSEFYRYICQDDNFKYLNGRDVNQSGVFEIVGKFIDQKKDNLRLLQVNLATYKDIYQYVYAHVFPEIYSTTEKRGIDLKSNFVEDVPR